MNSGWEDPSENSPRRFMLFPLNFNKFLLNTYCVLGAGDTVTRVGTMPARWHSGEGDRQTRKPIRRQFRGFPGGSVVKNLPANAEDAGAVGLVPGSGKSPGGGNGNPLQFSCLENSMDGGAWWATLHRVTKSQTRLSAQPSRPGGGCCSDMTGGARCRCQGRCQGWPGEVGHRAPGGGGISGDLIHEMQPPRGNMEEQCYRWRDRRELGLKWNRLGFLKK